MTYGAAMKLALLVASMIACSPTRTVTPVTPSEVDTRSPQVGKAPIADPPPPELRLPGDVRPQSYALDLTIVPDQKTATGRIKIDARVLRATRVVWLNATELTVTKATLGGAPARQVKGNEDFVGFTLDSDLLVGALPIEIQFTAPIDHAKSRGIYAETEGAETYAYTFFEPIDARRAFPCFDEPNYKVPWQLTFHVKKDHTALANAPVVREAPEADDMKRVELASTKPLPSYLIAFVVGPFELVDGGATGRVKTPIRFIIPKGRAGELGWAKNVTPRVVAALEDYFDMPYPYGKLDVAVVPRFWGTMEHPGIVAMGQPLTLIRPDQETRSRKQGYANILAHELSHYWFGDLVTMAWWDDTWLNEALGEWSDMNITEAVEPTWRYRDARVELATQAMSSDEQLATQSIRQPVTTKEGINASFDGEITYLKGSSVLRMFESSVGTEKWREMIRGYLRSHAWGNASADDFLRAVHDALGAEQEAGLRSFLEQPGVPHITAKLACTAGAQPLLELHQTRSLPAGVTDPQQRLWRVPVCVRYGDAKTSGQKCTLLDKADGELALDGGCPTWVLPNANATGYYRSTVDPALAKALLTPGSALAKAAKPTAAEKMMLVADLHAAVERDEVALDKLLELVPLVAADADERVALWSFEAGSFRADVLDDALYAKAKRFYVKTFGPAARKLGWTRAKTDSDERHQLRQAFVSVVAHEDAQLGKQAEALADKWLADRSGVDDDLVGAVLGTAAYRGDQARFDRVLDAAKHARDRTEKARILGVLGGFRDKALAEKALAIVSGTEFDLRDSLSILYGVMFKRETRALGLAWVQTHIDELLARMRDDEASWFLGALAGGSCTPELRATLSDLVLPRAQKIPGALAPVTRGLEQADQCIASFARQLPALQRFLAKQ